MLVSAKKLLINAKNEKKAVGAFNFTTFEQLKAIINGCVNQNTGCILATSESAINFLGLKNIVSIVKNEVEKLNIDFALHLDHGKSFEICKKCIDEGYTSVMIDASFLPFEENIKLTKSVCEYAHKKGVSVEGELGKIQGVEDAVSNKESILTKPEDALYFIKNTCVDSLAVSIGTSHGAYKFKGESKLEIKLLNKINECVNNFPLVLHGASSVSKDLVKNYNLFGGNLSEAKGIDNKNIIDAINNGICKVNVDTDLRIAFTTGVRKSLQDCSNFNLRNYLNEGINFMQQQIENRIKLFNNNN